MRIKHWNTLSRSRTSETAVFICTIKTRNQTHNPAVHTHTQGNEYASIMITYKRDVYI